MSRVLYAFLIASTLLSASALKTASHQGMLAHAGMNATMALHHHETPVRKVLDLLEKMKAQVEKEDKQDDEHCELARCHCKTKIDSQRALIEKLQANLPALETEYKELFASIKLTKEKTTELEKQLKEAREILRDMTWKHEKEYKEELRILGEYKGNIEAMTKAIAALEKGVAPGSASFLQSSTADILRKLASSNSSAMTDEFRESVTAFLDQGDGSQEESESPSTDEIIGILKQMKDTYEKDYKEMETLYSRHTAEYQAMKAAKEKEIEALKEEINTLTMKLGQMMVRLAEVTQMIDDLLKGSYLKEKALLDDMIAACERAQHVCETAKKLRLEEIKALSEAIELLGHDDSSDLFKKTLDHQSLLQVASTEQQLLKLARKTLNDDLKGKRDYRIDAISLAMTGKRIDFSQVIKMIENLIELLEKEEKDEMEKKDYCAVALGQAMFQKRFLDKKLAPIRAKIAEAEEALKAVADQIDGVAQELKDLNAEVEQRGKDRKADNAQSQAEAAQDLSAISLLKVAKKRLTSFYNFLQAKVEDYKPQDANEVLTLLSAIIHDLDLHMQANKDAEKMAQADYERFVKDAAATKSEKIELMQHLYEQKAVADDELQKIMDDYRQYHEEVVFNERDLRDVHRNCDWLLKNFQLRMNARGGELNALKNSKMVLQGSIGLEFHD